MEAAASIAAITDIRSLCRILNMPLSEKLKLNNPDLLSFAFFFFGFQLSAGCQNILTAGNSDRRRKPGVV